MSLLEYLKSQKGLRLTRAFFVFFYTVGIVGIFLPASRELMIKTTPLALLLSIFALALFQTSVWNVRTIGIMAFIFIAGFSVEVLGVQTGVIFGEYTYGNTLGIKLWETPLMIGLNWVLMVYLSSALIHKLKLNVWLKALISTLIMLSYDVVLEPVAPKLDMWSWSNDFAPFQNYLVWGILAFLFQSALVLAKVKPQNPIAASILGSQFLFFIALNFL